MSSTQKISLMFLRSIAICFSLLILSVVVLNAQPSDPDDYRIWKAEYVDSLRRHALEEAGGFRREMDVLLTENDYISGAIDETSGEIEIGADNTGTSGGTDYEKLTFSYDHPPGTSWLMYKVDDFAAEKTSTGGLTPSDRSYTIPSDDPALNGPIHGVEWDNYNGVNIRHEIQAVSLGSARGENEQCKIKIYITPADGECHDVGSIIFFDTMLDGSDDAEIASEFGYDGIAAIYYAPDVPRLWRAYEFDYPPDPTDLVGLGILGGFEATEPDVFWYGQWGSGTGNGWDDSEWEGDTGSDFGDSATMVKWNQREVCPGDTLVFCTYYGIGELRGTSVYSTHIPPTFEADCDSVYPNPYRAEAIIVNASTGDAYDIEAELITPTGVNVIGGNPVTLGNLSGFGASVYAHWDIELEPSTFGTTVNYDIQIIYRPEADPSRIDTVYDEFEVEVPPGPFSINASATDSTICNGENTSVSVDIVEGGSLLYTARWTPTRIVDNPYGMTTNVYPTEDTWVYVTVQDDLGCNKTDSVFITVNQPPTPPVLTTPPDGSPYLVFGTEQLVWIHATGTEPITYTLYVNDSMVVTDLSDSFYTIPTECSEEYIWYVIATNPCGSTASEDTFSFTTIPCGNPSAHVAHPFEDAWTSCADQQIMIYIADDYDIDTTSYVITVNGTTYSYPDTRISSSLHGDTLYFTPDPPFTQGTVTYTIDEANNIFGVGLDPMTSSFNVDLTPPIFNGETPTDGYMVLNLEPEIYIDIEDEDCGLDETSFTLEIEGYGTYDMSSPYLEFNSGRLVFDTQGAGIRFASSDTIGLNVTAKDEPDYCDGNTGTTSWTFNVEPTINCNANPNPFTPNGDPVNEQVVFSFPFMFSENAELKVYNKRHELVYKETMTDITVYEDFAERCWNGIDSDGNNLPAGLYIYIITRDDEVICNGTITLIR